MKRESRPSGRFNHPPRRAVIGGALIALAAFGVFAAHRSASATPRDRFVVAAREIPAGTVITRADLGSIALDLPAGLGAVAVEDAGDLIGRVASEHIEELGLLSVWDVYPADHFERKGTTRLVLDLPPARAMQGVTVAGDVVSVLSTDPQGSGTVVLTDSALVISIESPTRESIGVSGSVRVVLGVEAGKTAAEIVDAAVRSELTLVLGADGTGEEP